jgi:hypothetical protein
MSGIGMRGVQERGKCKDPKQQYRSICLLEYFFPPKQSLKQNPYKTTIPGFFF